MPKSRARKSKPARKRTAPAARPSDERFRLAEQIRPARYRVHIEPDLDAGTYRGRVDIELTLSKAAERIELHAADMQITAAGATAGRAAQTAEVALHPARETVELRFPQAIPPGKSRLTLEFSGRLQTSLRGFYGAESDGRRYGFTQLEAADARRFFPCFDEPSFKARFVFSVTTSAAHAVVSNSPIERLEEHGDGRKTVHFKSTPPLSTYLCALAVGQLECSAEKRVGRTPVRVWFVPGKGDLADFALEAAAESLSRLEKYFGLPYPYEKLDLVAVPDFEAGAMENAGAVFFRETLLLVDPATITLPERKRVAEVIAHELAHMWYGDLVTMKWWNDLWLNEAFATWMAFRVIDEWHPEWRMWNNFEHHRAAALALDALNNTHPIYAEVDNPAQATENFDAITYEKGASVVRMVENYLGANAFRNGVRKYIRRHREGNAEAADLWRALEEASRQKVTRIVRDWIEQPGFPLLEVSRTSRGGRTALAMRQQRFFASSKAKATPQTWPIPLVVKVPGRRAPQLLRHLMTRSRDRLDLGAGKIPWYYANAAEGGFYRPLHDEETLAALAASLSEVLTPVERMGLIGHQWAALRAGHGKIESFLSLADALRGETDFDVLGSLMAPLGFTEDQLLEDEGGGRRRFHRWVGSAFSPAWSELGWSAAAGESDDRRLRRAALLRIVGEIAEDPGVAAEARAHFEEYARERTAIEPNLADSLVNITARHGDEALYTRFQDLARAARTPQERRRFQLALAEFRRPALVRRTLALALTDAVATQDVGILLMRLFANRNAREQTWQFVVRRWKDISKRLPPMMVSRVVDSTPALKTRAYKKEVTAFFRAHPVPTAKRALKQALERFDLNEEFRRRAARGLNRWLAEKTGEEEKRM